MYEEVPWACGVKFMIWLSHTSYPWLRVRDSPLYSIIRTFLRKKCLYVLISTYQCGQRLARMLWFQNTFVKGKGRNRHSGRREKERKKERQTEEKWKKRGKKRKKERGRERQKEKQRKREERREEREKERKKTKKERKKGNVRMPSILESSPFHRLERLFWKDISSVL